MIAFGIDPGSRRTGFGVVRAEGNELRCLEAGVLDVEAQGELSGRLATIFQGLELKLAEFSPDCVVIESIFHHKSARSALVLGQARGVALLAASLSGRAIVELSPAEVKKAVTGSGRAEKHQIQAMVKILLGLRDAPRPDAADALALAIAGLAELKFRSAMGRARSAGDPGRGEP